jgi:uncharacterized membrane protein
MTLAAEFLPHLCIRLATVRADIAARIGGIVAVLKDFAPYAAVELILPGGSVLALLLWLYRRHTHCGRPPAPIPIGSGKDRSNAESFS